MNINSNIAALRKKRGYSQDEIASRLGVSRQTYMKMEKEGGIVTTDQLETLSQIFGVSIAEFYYQVQNIDKFREMYLYVLSKFSSGITKTKLAKLLYLADFRHFYDNLESMSGVMYKCKEYGPLADPFLELTDSMFDKGEINISILSMGAQMISLPYKLKLEDLELLSTQEKVEIDEICDNWKDSNTQTIVNFTHHQKPWMACRPDEVIPYELILQEDPDHVY